MRSVLFKAKRLDTGEWVEGVPVDVTPLVCFSSDKVEQEVVMVKAGFADWGMPRGLEGAKVDPATVCEFTGLTDSEGKKSLRETFSSSRNRTKGTNGLHELSSETQTVLTRGAGNLSG